VLLMFLFGPLAASENTTASGGCFPQKGRRVRVSFSSGIPAPPFTRRETTLWRGKTLPHKCQPIHYTGKRHEIRDSISGPPA